MQVEKLDHVNVRTTRLDILIDWYTSVLGLQRGDRPNFPFPGAWMYAGEHAVVHLVEITGAPGTGSESELKLEHFAFTATGGAEFQAKLKALGAHYKRVDIPEFNLYQINLWDPDGNHIHIDFPAEETLEAV